MLGTGFVHDAASLRDPLVSRDFAVTPRIHYGIEVIVNLLIVVVVRYRLGVFQTTDEGGFVISLELTTNKLVGISIVEHHAELEYRLCQWRIKRLLLPSYLRPKVPDEPRSRVCYL